ncbi:MAG TPA: YceI family protein, partial [Anaerolineae bacterium]|nr:YceI family protein [Anaerolineae bacterium]
EPTVAEVQPTQEPATPEPTATATATDVPPAEEPASTGGLVVFEIVPAESQARFVIDEVLRGAPKTVVGTTDQVSGQLAVDPADPSTAQVGTILINARTLATDSGGRDRALKNWILQTNQYEFVTFEPSGISGLPDSAAVGEPFTFQLAGDLTVRDTTVPVTFDVTVTPVSDTRLEGLASLTIPYRELNVSIPDSPSVDTVADDLTLELQFVATPVSGV